MRNVILSATMTLLAALALAGTGCVTTTLGPGSIVPMQATPMPPAQVPIARADPHHSAGNPRQAAPTDLDQADDPCATRLQDLSTPLLLYYNKYRRLPEKLDDVRELADPTMLLDFTCPVSGKPYIYNPIGLQAPRGDTLRLILYDATPAHNGSRWGVVAGPTPNRQGEMFLQMVVVRLTPKVFDSFKPVPPPLPQPAPINADPPLPPEAGGTPPGQ